MHPDVRDEFLNEALPCLDLVYNLARRSVRDRDVVEDLVQETFVKAFEAWTRGRRPRKVAPWMATICLNTARSYWRRASTRFELSVDEVESGETAADTVEVEALGHIRRDAVTAALWELPEEQRVVVTLMSMDGLTVSEIARATGCPRGTVLSRAHRGRKKLAEILRGKVEIPD